MESACVCEAISVMSLSPGQCLLNLRRSSDQDKKRPLGAFAGAGEAHTPAVKQGAPLAYVTYLKTLLVLRQDPNYIKAVNRRAGAYRYEESLRGLVLSQFQVWTSSDRLHCCDNILEKFQNKAAAQSVERVSKKLVTEKAQSILAVSNSSFLSNTSLSLPTEWARKLRLPSQTFISVYFSAFRKRELLTASCRSTT